VTDTPKPELTEEELVEFRAFLAERKARSSAGPPAPAPPPPPAEAHGERLAYIRGGAGMAVDTGRAVRIFGLFCLAALATLVILLTISASHQNSRLSRLQHHGVPVNVTVTGCVGLASGTGVTQYGFTCRGTFTLDGHSYNEVIGGSNSIHAPGEVLQALTIPSDPTLLSTTTAVEHRHSSHTVYITPAILLGVFVLGVILYIGISRRTRRTSTPNGIAGVAQPIP
jgi:hypothetical protein